MAVKKISITVLMLAIVTAIVFAVYRQQQAPNSASANSQAVNVQLTAATLRDTPQEIDAIGSLIAKNKVAISPEIAGQVSQIMFKAGEIVQKGTPLIKLDDTINRAQYKAVQAELKLSQLHYNRVTQLAKKGLTSQQSVDQALADLRDKQSTVHVKHTELQKMILVAPFAGHIGVRNLSIGDYVAVGQALVNLVSDDQLTVSYNVPENELAKLKLGQRVLVSTSAFPGEQFTGNVSFISPTVDVDTRSIAVEAEVPNALHRLSPGLYVRVKQNLGDAEQSVVVPEEALVPTISGQIVYVVQKGKAVSTPVKVGVRFKHYAQILSGIKAGDRVVTAGQQKLKDGAAVKVVTA